MKHKVMAAANKAVKTLIHGVKDIENRYINSIENMLTTKRKLAEMWGDVEPITEEQHKAVENALNTVK